MKCLIIAIVCVSSSAYAWEFTGNVDLEQRYFFEEGDPSDREQYRVSLAAEPELTYEKGNYFFRGKFFGRYDARDEERSHADIRELEGIYSAESYELRVGIRKVFWGVAESFHLIDIINQTDFIENLNFEQKLGQPMVNFAWITDWGTVDFFVMSYHRERTFARR